MDPTNLSAGDFSLICHKSTYVDKTLLIKAVLREASTIILLTAPRRFGKSINLSMLHLFFAISNDKKKQRANRALFENLQIANEKTIMKEHCGKYPVILLNFKPISNIESFKNALTTICNTVNAAYRWHSYLESSEKLDAAEKEMFAKWKNRDFVKNPLERVPSLSTALMYLVMYLNKHWNRKVIILVDEYDALCSSGIIHINDVEELEGGRHHLKAKDEIEAIKNLCMYFLASVLKNLHQYVERGIMTGISLLAPVWPNVLNNVVSFQFQDVHEFSDFYGLTPTECKRLLSKFNLDNRYDEVKKHYGGYRNGMLNIWSIMNFLTTKDAKNYWNDTGSPVLLQEALRNLYITEKVQKLTSDISNQIEVRYFNKFYLDEIVDLKNIMKSTEFIHNMNDDIFFNFLLQRGYLKIVDYSTSWKNYVNLQVPNEEIKSEFKDKLELYFTKTCNIDQNKIT